MISAQDIRVDVYVIHFREDALKEGFFDLPELTLIKGLFALGTQGVLIRGEDHKKISELVKEVVKLRILTDYVCQFGKLIMF